MKSEGIDVCGFGAGEPDFDTPDTIKAAAIARLKLVSQSIRPSGGLPELRQAIAEKLRGDNQLKISTKPELLSAGCQTFVLQRYPGNVPRQETKS
jgi:aspartate aminotransferase